MRNGSVAGRIDSTRAAELGRRGARARWAGRLTLQTVEEALGPLASIADAKRRLERIGVWASAGLLPGAAASAAVRSCEVWLKAVDTELSFEELDHLRDALRQVRAERDELARQLRARPA